MRKENFTPTSLGDQPAPSRSETSCEFRVSGMDCPSCADDVRRSLEKLEGVHDIQVDVLGGRVRVSYAADKLVRGDLAGAIQRIGYQVEDGEPRTLALIVE